MESYAYDYQLRFLALITQALQAAGDTPVAFTLDKRMALSLAESVKQAREHNTDCLPARSLNKKH